MMYVIQGTLPADHFGVTTNLVTDVYTIPAESCVWTVAANAAGGYSIADVYWTVGATNIVVSAAQLGHVSKTCRFVKHTV